MPMTINSKYPTFDPASILPAAEEPICAKFIYPGSPFSGIVSTATVPAARQVFIARQNQKPVLMYVSPSVLSSGVAPVIIDMLKKKYVTGIAMSTATAACDYAMNGGTDTDKFQAAIIRGARAGAGLGESLASALFTKNRETSLLAAAYDLNVPVTVHGILGELPSDYHPFKNTAEYGAAFGATSYVDALVLARQIEQMAGDVNSLFINTGSPVPGTRLFAAAMRMLQQAKKLKFDKLKLLRLSAKRVESAADVCVCAPYRELFPALLVSCDAIYEGGFDVFTNKNTGEQFAAFGFIKQCVENVREKPEAGSES